MKRVLLTGARGFIGSHCLPKLLASGFEVHAVRTGAPPCSNGDDRLTWHQADLFDQERVAELVDEVKPSHLLHLAWIVSPGVLWASPLNWKWVNASLTLLRAFGTAGGGRVVMAGSCAEYEASDRPCIEGVTPLASASLYGASKAALSLLMPAFARQYGIGTATWARIFYLYGPGETPSRLVPEVIRSLLRGQPIACSHGNQVRDFLHVEDVANALVLLLKSPATGAVNVASGQPTTIRDLLTTIGAEIGREDLLQFGARPVNPDEPPVLVADISRLTREIGWSQTIGLQAGIRESIDWWRREGARADRNGGITCA